MPTSFTSGGFALVALQIGTLVWGGGMIFGALAMEAYASFVANLKTKKWRRVYLRGVVIVLRGFLLQYQKCLKRFFLSKNLHRHQVYVCDANHSQCHSQAQALLPTQPYKTSNLVLDDIGFYTKALVYARPYCLAAL